MKQTIYFNSNTKRMSQIGEAINEVMLKRDEFIKSNKDEIGEKEGESLQIIVTGPHRESLIAIITFHYFPKK